MTPMSDVPLLTGDQRTWAEDSERLWRRAHQIASTHKGLDVGDVYHALRSLQRTPADRLRQSLSRARLRAYSR
jgi:hypothetical protein